MDDIRYSELKFLRAVADRSIDPFWADDQRQMKAIGISGELYLQMAIASCEDLYVHPGNAETELLVARLRNELATDYAAPSNVHDYQWSNPRQALLDFFRRHTQPLRITYRGLQRIETLRDMLRRDRILDHFGVLLDFRYFHADLEEALQRTSDTTVSVLYADMDDFGMINKKFGHAAGNVVMEAYLKTVRDTVGLLGTGYRGVGDETKVIIIGQGRDRAIQVAEEIRRRVESLRCEYQGIELPLVTASIGLATTPPDLKTMEIENLADQRQQQAKDGGKNRVIA